MNRNLTAVILIVLAGGIFYTFTRDQLAEARAIKEVNQQYASAIQSAEELIKVRDKVLTQYNSLTEADRDRLDKIIPSTVDNIRLIIDLNSIAVKHGFTLKNIKASAPQKEQNAAPTAAVQPQLREEGRIAPIAEPTLDTVTVSFSVTAPYQQFIAFLQDVESSLRIMDVTRLKVTAAETGTFDFGVELKTYWLRQQ